MNGDELMNKIYATPASKPASKPAPIPMKTKFKWSSGPGNYRIAIQTPKGMLQVKAEADGVVTHSSAMPGAYHPGSANYVEMFADYDAWAKSLPPTGEITGYEHDTRTIFEKRLAEPIPGLSDATLVRSLIYRFKIKSSAWLDPSLTERLRNLQEYERYWVEEMQMPGVDINYYRNRLKSVTSNMRRIRRQINTAVADHRPMKFKSRGNTGLYVQVDVKLHEIAYYLDKIVDFFENDFNSFAEMGADMVDGKPVLAVIHNGVIHKLK